MFGFRKKEDIPNSLLSFLEKDLLYYANIVNSFNRGTVEIIHSSEVGFIVYETVAHYYAIDAFDIPEMIKVIESLPSEVDLSKCVLCYDEAIMKYLWGKYSYNYQQECVQVVVLDTAAVQKYKAPNLAISPATNKDLQYVYTAYQQTSIEVIQEAIQDNRLYIAYNPDNKRQRVGFAGIHNDTSIGFKYIEPLFRRRGYGSEILKHISGICVKRKLIPYMHILSRNIASIKMVTNLNFKVCDRKLWWISDELW